MEPMRRSMEASGCRQRGEADCDPNTADCDDSGAGALQNGDHETGPIEPASARTGQLRVRRSA